NAVAHPAAETLHRVVDDRTRTIAGAACAGIEAPGAGHPAALLHHRAGAVLLRDLPAARADRDGLLGPHRLIGAIAAHRLPGFRHRSVAGDGHLADVLLVDRVISAVVLRHLVFLPAGLVGRVALLAHMLLVDRVIGAVVLRHLIFLPTGLVSRVALLARMLLVDRVGGALILWHLVLLPERLVARAPS